MLSVNYISMKWEGRKEKAGRKVGGRGWLVGGGERGRLVQLGIQWTLRCLAALWPWAGQGWGSPTGKSREGLAQSQGTAF